MILEIRPDGVFIDDRRVPWPIVELNHNQDPKDMHCYAGRAWPHRGFTVACENGWFVQVSHRYDYDYPDEGTPSQVNVHIAPYKCWTDTVNRHTIRDAMVSGYGEEWKTVAYVLLEQDVGRIGSIVENASRHVSPPKVVMDAVRLT